MLIKTADGLYRELRGHYGAVAEELRGTSEANIQRWFEDARRRRDAGLLDMTKTALDVEIDWAQFWVNCYQRLVQVAHPVGFHNVHSDGICELDRGSHCEDHCPIVVGLRAEQSKLRRLLVGDMIPQAAAA